MDETLERLMKEHLDGASSRDTEIKLMQARLNRGDDDFCELKEEIESIAKNTQKILFLLNGCDGQEGIVCKVNRHENIVLKFFGAIGLVTFMGVATLGVLIITIWNFIKIKMWGV